MNATIFKDDEFKTAGIKVVLNDVTIFQWGANWEDGYYTKTINADKYTEKIMELIELKRIYEYYSPLHGFCSDVFDLLRAEGNKEKFDESKLKDGIRFGEFDQKSNQAEARMIRLINEIH
ncbi:MAG: hypothetical protein KBS77_06405 [Bacteroidales bacterium]|nr:hypothetical protein [Candidatus Colicola faecequi]